METISMYTLSFSIAELYPILIDCRSMPYAKTMLSVFADFCQPPITNEYYVTKPQPRTLD